MQFLSVSSWAFTRMLLCGETAPGSLNPRRIFGGSRLTVKRNTDGGKWDNQRRYRLGRHSDYGWLIDSGL
jgi:hypothetical protein